MDLYVHASAQEFTVAEKDTATMVMAALGLSMAVSEPPWPVAPRLP